MTGIYSAEEELRIFPLQSVAYHRLLFHHNSLSGVPLAHTASYLVPSRSILDLSRRNKLEKEESPNII